MDNSKPQVNKPTDILTRKLQALHIEYEAEKEEFRRQSEAMGIARKVKRGICWYPIKIERSYYNSLNQFAVEISRSEDTDIDHGFEYGRQVQFFQCNFTGTPIYYSFTATVSYADEEKIVIILPSTSALTSLQMSNNQIGVQLYFDETSYKLMFQAMNDVIAAKGNRLAELRDIIHGNLKPGELTFSPLRFPWLNSSQDEAVNRVLHAKDVAIVHGPPGTGKTTTLVETIYETLHRENQVLVCAQSNMAVDWISEKLVDRGVSVLRIGNPRRVTDKMLSFTFERRFESHPDYPQLWSIRKAIRQLQSQPHKKEGVREKINSLKDRATELEMRITAALFDEARVIVSTLVGSANRLLVGHSFSTLFIDEGAQAMEPACWIAMRRAHRVVLAGDHCQLPPTIKSPEAMRAGLGRTLMQEITEHKPECVSLLTIQYRMNDEIMRFPSEWFYGGRLQSAPEVKYRGILDYETAIEWVDTEELEGATEEFVGETFGRINRQEAERCVELLKGYIEKIGKQRFLDERIDVGIISPYKAQVQYLRRLIQRDPFFKPYRQSLSVNTVDGFQGQERDIIMISLVRANEDGQIGFLNDLRRMNVAITRARMKVIILGDVSTLTHHPFYRRLYEYVCSLT